MAFLAIEGLRRYDLTEHSRPIVDALLRLFLSEWDTHSHVRENYPATVGEDVRAFKARSDGLMAWGGLLAYLAFGELADARPDGWHFAHPGTPAELANLPLGDGRLTVSAGERLTVTLDDQVLFDAAPGIVVTGFRGTATGFTGTASGNGDLHVGDLRLIVDGTPRHFNTEGGTPA
jgi:hypothetical protein